MVGSSGSSAIDAKDEVIGAAFDGNIESPGGDAALIFSSPPEGTASAGIDSCRARDNFARSTI
jgi:hypothetical protein